MHPRKLLAVATRANKDAMEQLVRQTTEPERVACAFLYLRVFIKVTRRHCHCNIQTEPYPHSLSPWMASPSKRREMDVMKL